MIPLLLMLLEKTRSAVHKMIKYHYVVHEMPLDTSVNIKSCVPSALQIDYELDILESTYLMQKVREVMYNMHHC